LFPQIEDEFLKEELDGDVPGPLLGRQLRVEEQADPVRGCLSFRR
jgi:hypothetical protein